MVLWILNSLMAFLLCVFCAGILIPQILLIAFRKRLFDIPDERKIHHVVVPRLGGFAFKPVIVFSLALLLGINLLLGYREMLSAIVDNVQTLSFGYCAILLLYLTGMADDLVGIRYKAKFIVQMFCAILLIAGGIWVGDLHGLLGIHEIPTYISWPLTLILIIFIINAVNLIDGIDGLASGLSCIACLSYGICFFAFGHYLYAMMSFATLGVLVPFFYYNVFGNPDKQKKIFMGDTGSLTIGLILCVLSIKMVSGYTEAIWSVNPLIIAFTPLLVPGCDVIRVFLRRVRNGKNPFLPDQTHIHHKLLALGISQHISILIIFSMSISLILLNILLSRWVNVNIVLVGDVMIWTLGNIWLTKRIGKYKQRENH